MLSVRDQQVVLERDRGDTIVEIGGRHGISHQRVSVLMARATEFVNQVDLDLMVAHKTGEACAYLAAVDAKRRELVSLDAQREKRMTELSEIGITPLGLEVIERIDAERAARHHDIEEAEAVLSEWTAQLSADGMLDFFNRIVDVVQGRVAQADGIAEINAALHDSLLGVWLGYDDQTLTADIRVRPSGLDDYDAAVAELFGTLPTRQETDEMLKRLFPDEPTICRPRTYLQGIDTEEIIATVHARRAPMMSATAGLQL